jgi:hypothetical protein
MSRDQLAESQVTTGVHGEGAALSHGPAGHGAGAAATQRILSDPFVLPNLGDGGVLSRALDVEVTPGHRRKIPEGTYAEVQALQPPTLEVKLWSGFNGMIVTIPLDAFHAEPLLARGENGDADPDRFSYMRHTGRLWNGHPTVDDVSQGMLGDCYLISALGAIVAGDPNAITSMFDPPRNGMPSYRIRLYDQQPDGSFKPDWVTVDTYLPTYSRPPMLKRLQPTYLASYGQMDQSTADIAHPRWPALLEKAIAQKNGGYHLIGTGGKSSAIMQMVLGKPATFRPVPGSDEELLAFLRGEQRANRPVTAGTLSNKEIDRAQAGGFTLAPDGAYVKEFTTEVNGRSSPMDIKPSSLVVTDAKGKAPQLADDGKGAILGAGATGTVDYANGKVRIQYESGKGPADPGDLQAVFRYSGVIDTANNVHANHAYMFERVDDQNRIIMKNPWGNEHPSPLTPAAFRADFTTFYQMNVPQTDPAPASRR